MESGCGRHRSPHVDPDLLLLGLLGWAIIHVGRHLDGVLSRRELLCEINPSGSFSTLVSGRSRRSAILFRSSNGRILSAAMAPGSLRREWAAAFSGLSAI